MSPYTQSRHAIDYTLFFVNSLKKPFYYETLQPFESLRSSCYFRHGGMLEQLHRRAAGIEN